jgi:hypothetical protein
MRNKVTRLEMTASMRHATAKRQVIEYKGVKLRPTYDFSGILPDVLVCGQGLHDMWDFPHETETVYLCLGEQEPGSHNHAYKARGDGVGVTVDDHPDQTEDAALKGEGYWIELDDETALLLEELMGEYEFYLWLEIPS